jgi:hypothetical protein
MTRLPLILRRNRRACPVAAFFQPVRNLSRLAAMGVDTVFGPEVESAGTMTPAALDAANQAWIAETQRLGLKVVLKRPTFPLPSNCVGVLVIYDEANGKNIPPAASKPKPTSSAPSSPA